MTLGPLRLGNTLEAKSGVLTHMRRMWPPGVYRWSWGADARAPELPAAPLVPTKASMTTRTGVAF